MVLSMRLRPDLYEQIRKGASQNGRSISAEAEFRLMAFVAPLPLTEDRVRAIVLQEMARNHLEDIVSDPGHLTTFAPGHDWLRIAS